MRILSALLLILVSAALLFVSAIGLSGAGHGWGTGAMGCLLLIPVGAIALWNPIAGKCSRRIAKYTLVAGVCVLLFVLVATKFGELSYFMSFWRRATLGNVLLLSLTCFHWVLASGYVFWATKNVEQAA